MFRNRKTHQLLAATAVLCLTGCVTQTGGVGSSSKPLGNQSYEVLGEVEGTDSRIAILGILPITGANTTKEALEDAMAQIPGTEAIIEVTADTHSEYWILWSNTRTVIRGKAVRVTGNNP